MTPATLSRIHGAAFKEDRGWSDREFAELLGAPFTTLLTTDHGFALTRLVAGEAELITIAVDPDHQGQGQGQQLVSAWLDHLERAGADVAFLEVAADNAAALHLYIRAGFRITARRHGYYPRTNRAAIDALVLSSCLIPRQSQETTT